MSLICLLFFTVCSRRELPDSEETIKIEPDPILLRAEEIVSSFDDRHLAAQLLISGIDGSERLSLNMVELLTEIPAGGVLFFRFNLNTNSNTIKNLLNEAVSVIEAVSGIPPFLAVDHEGGTVYRFPHNIAILPDASFYWELSLTDGKESALSRIEEDSYKSGSEINALGFNMNFAPVAEHLIDENRIFLSKRSYGPDPVFTAQAASAFVRGMKKAGILCVVKHFPGSAGLDPHYFASVLHVDKEALDILASPFVYLINNGARAIMAAHTSVPIIDKEIASLSSLVMDDWLRGELGFDGLIISDDFVMEAAGGLNPEEAAIRSVAAGSDMIFIWPGYLRRTHDAFVRAIADEQLPRERVQNAALRIVYEKLKLGLLE